MRSCSARQGHFQQTDDTVRLAAAGSHRGRQEQHITFTEGIISHRRAPPDRPRRGTPIHRGICALPTTKDDCPLIRVTPN